MLLHTGVRWLKVEGSASLVGDLWTGPINRAVEHASHGSVL